MGPPGREKDGMDAARVIALVCVIAIVGTLFVGDFPSNGPSEGHFY